MIETLANSHSGPLIISSETVNQQFALLVDLITGSLAPTSRRVYANTYRQWRAYTEGSGLAPFDLSFENIAAFLNQSDIAYATRQSWKTHMLRLLDWLEESEARGEWYGVQRRRVLKFVKVKRMEDERGGRRSQRALNRTEVVRLLDVWANDQRPVGIRNHALLRLMIYTSLRRAEIVMLHWDDIDFDDWTVTVRHGKGDKRRVAAIADATDATIKALYALWEAQEGACHCIFPTMTVGRNPRFVSDTPMSAQTIARLLKLSSERAGIGHLSAHDLAAHAYHTGAEQRRPPPAGYASASRSCQPLTTLLYAQPSEAKTRRARIAF